VDGYRDRAEAGRALVEHLAHRRGATLVVLGVAGGGVVVAAEVAKGLGAFLGAVAVAHLRVPGTGLLIGAVAADGAALVDDDLVPGLGIDGEELADEARRASSAARERQRLYRPLPAMAEHGVLVVDDGMATGLTVRAALRRVRREHPAWLGAAVPVGLPAAVDIVAAEADEVVCPLQPLRLGSVGEWYREFPEVGDAEAALLVEQAEVSDRGPRRPPR
jgi:putative phosphoribosyl transferase